MKFNKDFYSFEDPNEMMRVVVVYAAEVMLKLFSEPLNWFVKCEEARINAALKKANAQPHERENSRKIGMCGLFNGISNAMISLSCACIMQIESHATGRKIPIEEAAERRGMLTDKLNTMLQEYLVSRGICLDLKGPGDMPDPLRN